MSIYIYIYIRSLYIHIHIHVCVYIHTHMYMYMLNTHMCVFNTFCTNIVFSDDLFKYDHQLLWVITMEYKVKA